MQQFYSTMQRLSLIVLSLPAHHGILANATAQRVIVPICRRGLFVTHH
jgi:hypothetical protein